MNGNTPVLAASDTVLAGDIVRVVVRAPRHTPLATLVATPAASVNDLSARTRPAGRLFLFGATAAAIDTTAHTITVDVNFGNWRGLFALLGQPVHQTFKYDSSTVFLKWRRGVPIGVDPSVIHAGDPLTLRVFGATWNTPLATLLATPLWRVKAGEPMRLALQRRRGAARHLSHHHPRGPLTPHSSSSGESRTLPPATGPADTAGPVCFSRRVASPEWSVCGHRGA